MKNFSLMFHQPLWRRRSPHEGDQYAGDQISDPLGPLRTTKCYETKKWRTLDRNCFLFKLSWKLFVVDFFLGEKVLYFFLPTAQWVRWTMHKKLQLLWSTYLATQHKRAYDSRSKVHSYSYFVLICAAHGEKNAHQTFQHDLKSKNVIVSRHMRGVNIHDTFHTPMTLRTEVIRLRSA